MATSRLPAPSCLPTAPCEPCAPYSFLKTNATVNRNKEATYFIYVSKVWWKEGRKERVGHITLSAGWYHSILADQFSQTEGDEKGASTSRGWGGGGTEMVVVLICQRNTALRVLLKRPHKPELSGVGGHILTFGHTDVDCEFSAWLSCTQSYPSTSCGNRRMGPGSSHWPIHLNFLQSSDNKSELRVQSVAFYGAFKCICQYSSADFA